MNERIKELAKLARYYSLYEKHSLQEIHKREITLIEYQDIYDKKFAELIVRECIRVIDNSTPVYSSEDLQEDYCQGNLNGHQSALLEIKQHFGVEE